MRWRAWSMGVWGLVMTASLISACRHNYVGCKQYDNMSAEATYCRLHREAVWDYVELSNNPAGQEGRTFSMVRLLRNLNQCSDYPCLESEINADTLAQGFAAFFNNSHAEAEQGASGTNLDRQKIVLCGLENGVRDWVDSLKMEVDLND